MISPFFFSIFPCISLICVSNRELESGSVNAQLRKFCNSHFLVNELQPPVYSALRIWPLLLEEHRADELVDGLVIL